MALMALRAQFPGVSPPSHALPPDLGLVEDWDESDGDWTEDMTIDLAAFSGTKEDEAEDEEEAIVALDETVQAIDRGLKWMLAMQNKDGGWGAFDRNNDRQFLCYVPFADHNAMIDPSTPDLTGRVLESLGKPRS
jgi:squalene-hopene/tetraprenyl-beta-curcumene cyclase